MPVREVVLRGVWAEGFNLLARAAERGWSSPAGRERVEAGLNAVLAGARSAGALAEPIQVVLSMNAVGLVRAEFLGAGGGVDLVLDLVGRCR